MEQPDFEAARQYASARLHELPASLSYHSIHHTRDGVVPAVERFAAWEGVDGESLLLLRTAAWYHDIGFIEQPLEHEAIGVRIAATVLPQWGYSLTQIGTIAGMIMATKLPQSPHTKLEALLADADLDVLGRPDFLARNEDLRNELAAFGTQMTDCQWLHDQLAFVQSHRYWTEAARALRDGQKRRNLQTLIRLLEGCQDRSA